MKDNNTEICCYMFGAKENNLKKGQKPGQATITMANGKEEIVHSGMPIIPTTAATNALEISGDKVYRINGNKRTEIRKSAKEARQIIRTKGILPNKQESIRD